MSQSEPETDLISWLEQQWDKAVKDSETPDGEQHRVHLVVRFRLNVRIGDSRGRRGGQHLGHALPGDPQRSGDRPPGQTLVVEAEYRLGLDFPYHCR